MRKLGLAIRWRLAWWQGELQERVVAWTRQPQTDGEKGTDVRFVEEGERTGLGAGLGVGGEEWEGARETPRHCQ